MGQVVPFIARVRDSGDWSAGERARLEDLADQLGHAGVNVEVIFGATDEGDPWCVVTDADGEVLIHVARIGGVFVVHSAVDDAMSEGVDLHTALRERLAVTEDAMAPKSATILPFELRQAQTLLALVAAAAFFYETAGAGEAHAAEPPHAPSTPDDAPPPVAAHDHDTASQDREVIARGAALQADETAPAATSQLAEAPAPAAAPIEAAPVLPAHLDPTPAPAVAVPAVPLAAPPAEPEAPPVVIQGTAGDDLLVGTAANEHILGGAGNDTLEGGGGQDTLDGGAGDDRIELAAGVVAIGGTGADTFVIRGPHGLGGPGPGGPPPEGFFFGTVLDLSGAQGDHVVNGQGMTVRLTPHPDGATLTGPGGAVATFTTTTVLGHPVTRVDVDLDGDGVNDGYLLVGHPPPPPGEPPGAPGDHEPPPITVTGQSLPLDPFG